MIEIRKCKDEDIPALSCLWQNVFGDEKNVTDSFFSLFGSKISYILLVNGKTVSSLHMIPCKLITDGEELSGKYLYAAATNEQYRSKGFMKKLIEFAVDSEKQSGEDFICLYPAEESLYGYYMNFGFESVCRAAYTDLIVTDKCADFTSSEQLINLRNGLLSGNYISLCKTAFDFYIVNYAPVSVYDYTEDGYIKMPVANAGLYCRDNSFTVKKDGMYLPLTEKANNIADVYIGLTLE